MTSVLNPNPSGVWWVLTAFLRLGSAVGAEGAQVFDGRSLQANQVSCAPSSLIHVFIALALCTDAQSCWVRKGLSAKLFPQSWGHVIIQNIWWALPLPVSKTMRPISPPPRTRPASPSRKYICPAQGLSYFILMKYRQN